MEFYDLGHGSRVFGKKAKRGLDKKKVFL